MSTFHQPDDKMIETKGLWLFGGLSGVLALSKLLELWEWSWWRAALPVLIFAVFNALYIAIGFLYLSVVFVPQRSQEEETYLLRTQTETTLYWTGLIFVSGFTLNLVSRLETGKASMGGWLFSGRLEVLSVFAAFAVVSLWWYWSRIGHLLNDGDDSLG
jgi:hypothetical protein